MFLASSLAQDDTIIVSLTSSDEHVEKGGSVSFTCEWTLNADYSKSFYVSLYRPYGTLYGESYNGLVMNFFSLSLLFLFHFFSTLLDPCENAQYLSEHESLQDCLDDWDSTVELQEESGKKLLNQYSAVPPKLPRLLPNC